MITIATGSKLPMQCDCGSGFEPVEEQDGYGIHMFYACAKCYSRKLKPFREDIFTQYPLEPGEQIEDDY